MTTLSLKLVGTEKNADRVRLADFKKFCDNLSGCLDKIADKITSTRPGYDITGLTVGSTIIEIEPAQDALQDGGEVLGLFGNTVAALQAGEVIDNRLDESNLQQLRRLANPLGKTIRQIWVGDIEITTDYVANIDRRLAKPICTCGTIKGTLDRVNVHEKNEFFIYPPLPFKGSGIPCLFPEEMVDTVREALKCKVTVTGKLYYLQDAAFPRQVHVENIEIHPPDEELPTLLDLKGIAPECTGGLPVLEYLRSIPDE